MPVNKKTAEYQYQMTDTRQYRARLRRAKYVSLIDLKAGFHNIPFDHETSFNSTFSMHKGKYRWVRMPMGLTQAPAHFQYVVESVIKEKPEDETLPAVVYLDDIAIYGDSVDEVLDATAKVIHRLTDAGFMINLKKCHLVETYTKILGHMWSSGGYWTPITTKLEALMTKTHEELSQANRASLYGLLNFYRDYVPHFAEMTEPIRQTLA